MKKEILLLAKSPKNLKLCVVGLDLETGTFVRLLSKIGSELMPNHLRCSNGIDAEVLDVVEVDFLAPAPSFCHQEDWRINTDIPFKYLCPFGVNDLKGILSTDPFIFGNTNYALSLGEAKVVTKSILLVKITDIQNTISVSLTTRKIRNKLFFNYKGRAYADFAITDFKYRHSRSKISYKEALAVMTLANPIDTYSQEHGLCYKFIAQLFPLDDPM
ncbi:dual OB domain-containing protein [Candidatus Avelusimicrobium luingense]|uniref:dual OB domain-containing protein n=1 Tax=Candidatus Avelusimicrobium luingense TaxID=3416211 RepID=UPI003D106465